ncbi:MAG: hypothetical protein EON52_21340 [Actinomycetales bacterium]|nr:MAG: hypothetical protein EON52_21340 [Actinomycetales bacterium]
MLDADAVRQLGRCGVVVVGVGTPERAAAVGIEHAVRPDGVVEAVRRLGGSGAEADGSIDEEVLEGEDGRLVVVWGPSGSPGRSTVALSLAAALAAGSERSVVLVDADTYGGSQGQALGLLDDVSGLAAACRAANQGHDEVRDHLVAVAPGLHLLSGVPTAQMWRQVRPAALERVVDRLVRLADVVVADVGFCLEAPESGGRGRNDVTLAMLQRADEVVVVGRADPVGLGRLVRGVHELAELGRRDPVIVLNRSRRTVGWSETEVVQTVTRLTGVAPALVLPDDASLHDAALMSGRLPREVAAQSPFVVTMEGLAGRLVGLVTV